MSKTLNYLLRYLGVSMVLLLLFFLVGELAPAMMDTFTYPPWAMALALFIVLFVGHLAALVLYGIWHVIRRSPRQH